MIRDPFIDALADEGLSQDVVDTLNADTSFADAEGNTGEWLDADTLRVNGDKIRLAGYDAKEVAKYLPDGSIKEGEIGGDEQTAQVSKLARDLGYTQFHDTGEVDPYGRKIMDLRNAAGSSFADELTATGVVKPGRYTSQRALEAQGYETLYQQAAKAHGVDDSAMKDAADMIDAAIQEAGGEFAGFKKIAYNEQELQSAKQAGVGKYYVDDAVQVRNPDRYYDNRAKSPLSVAWDSGLQGVLEGGAGFLNLVGHETGWQGLESWSEGVAEGIQQDLSNKPTIILDYKEVVQNPDGSFISPSQILGRTDEFLEYVGNMAAISLPYMATTLGAAALAPYTAGLSLTAPAAVYGGQTWNEMEGEKNAAMAIAAGVSMAALDRLGLKGISNTALMSKEGREEIIEKLAAQGIGREEAAQKLIGATRLEAAKLSGDAVQFAKEQLGVRKQIRQLLKTAGVSSAWEGGTEVAQEAIGYLAAVNGSDKEYNDNEFLDRLTNAAIGGGVLGGAFSIPGTAYNTGAWVDVAHRLAPADQKRRVQQNRWAEEEIKENGRLQSHEEILADAERAANARRGSGIFDESINVRAKRDEERRGARGFSDTMSEMWEAVPGLWRGATRHIFNDDLQSRSPTARRIASLFGGQLNQMYSGSTFENSKHLKLAEYKNLIARPAELVSRFGFETKGLTNKQELKQVSDIMYDAYNRTKGDWDKLVGTDLEPHLEAIKATDKELRRLADKTYKDQKKYNPKLGLLKDYAYRHKSIDRRKVEADTPAFTKELQDRFGLSSHEAAELTDQILNQNDPFSLTALQGFKPGSHKGRTLNLSDDAEFAGKWLNDNLFDNASDIAKSAARYTSYQQFLGEDNKILNSLINEMEGELIESGMSKDEAKQAADKAARGMRDYLDAESGNYKRPKTNAGRWLQAAQKDFMFLTTLAALPLATLSSFVEFAMTYRALEGKQVKQMNDIALKEAKEMVKNFWNEKDFESKGRQVAKDAGFFEWEVGAATVTGATEISARKQEWSDMYFRAIGLKQWTDYTRAMRGAISQDYLLDKLDRLSNADPKAYTNEDVEARDALRNLGLNVEDALEIYNKNWAELTDADTEQLQKMMRDSTFNFINEAVVLPQAALRPLFYQDPRFALFTQFHGFISTFQANHLPKMYRQAYKGQTPAMKYNAFAVMATMILIGFLSQYLKDLLKFGRSTPYLTETGEFVQRGIGASGLLGTGERVLNVVNPIYEQRYDSTPEWAFDTLTGESAAISKGKELIGAGGDFLSGEPNAGAKKVLKSVPFVGPFTGVRHAAADWVFDEE